MLAQTLLRRAVRAACTQSVAAGGLLAPLGKLHFADRAVKTTSQQPQFICLHGLLATRSEKSSALVTAVEAGFCSSTGGTCTCSANRDSNGSVRSEAFLARVQLQGDSAVCALRGPHVVFLCRGDAVPQTHEITLATSDVIALVSDVAATESLDRLFSRVGAALRQQCDIEYAAEEVLLSLAMPAAGGNTALIGKVGLAPSSTTEPPQSSQCIS